MKFSEFKYTRPDYEVIKNQMENLIEKIENSENESQQYENILEINKIRNHIFSMKSICYIRHTINTEDTYYDSENNYWDEQSPLYEELDSKFYKAIVNSKFRVKLEERLTKHFFNLAENSLKSFSPEIIEDLQEENRLGSQYQKLIASAKIIFENQEYNLSGLTPLSLNKDREIRRKSLEAKYNFFKENEDKIDEIFDKLVKVRDKISKKLGLNNFVELGYIRMDRTDYNPEMVANFRKQVKEFIVPIASELYKNQQKRLGIDTLRYYDEKFEFEDGNAIPKGDAEWILKNGSRMYSELSEETDDFFKFMVENELLDLKTKAGKAGGGYCDYISEYKSPFIFSNFNGTSGDIDVLTHEAGHAFQAYRSSWIEIPELNFPTYESCEIHSMSMEFFTWPWMNLFFEEDADKYKFSHLGGAIKFLPYGITVDAFQHEIYENPNLTPKERKDIWRKLEKQYLPHKNYEGCEILENGGWWFQQSHIFQSPFYYIDYTLAQMCALQFWKKMNENRDEAWKDYLNLCDVGGTKSFLELVKLSNLISPFEDGCVSSVVAPIENWLKENLRD
ncbi:M3 family oligoendopeptidase [Cetobacterium sp. 2A]|uniref:M3 family oligoendopeptidase n=1 Tax=Cetobacterium sp. 2A TaxID=2754723 RepID=UPI00163CEE91|nr:M3 family oligoendopeptidase [Cetobacterium sp. 2A]